MRGDGSRHRAPFRRISAQRNRRRARTMIQRLALSPAPLTLAAWNQSSSALPSPSVHSSRAARAGSPSRGIGITRATAIPASGWWTKVPVLPWTRAERWRFAAPRHACNRSLPCGRARRKAGAGATEEV